jgi:hypothetical protein
MKYTTSLAVIFIFISTIFSCSNNDDSLNLEKSLVGEWQLVETYVDPGDGSGSWQKVDNGFFYIFSPNGQFTSNRFSECKSGKYAVVLNKLTLDYNCEGFTTGVENPEGIFVEEITFESSNMIMKPTYLFCIEGCGWKFKRVK